MKSSSALTAAKTVIRWLRWAAVLALVCSGLGALVYSALGPQGWALRPAPLAVVQIPVSWFDHYVLRETAFVVAGALIAPRFRLTTALVLAALQVAFSFWGHVLAAGGPWWSWTINYTHFTLETLGSVLAVAYIFWSEKAKRSVASVPPLQLSLLEPSPRPAGIRAALTAAKTVIRWLRWAGVLAFVYSALGGFVYAALHVRAPAPLAAVGNLVFMLDFYVLRETAFVVAGALIAPRARLTTAIVLAAVYVPLSFWNHVLSRVTLVELVLLQGAASYKQFTLEGLGFVLGVVFVFWSEKAKGSVASVTPGPPRP